MLFISCLFFPSFVTITEFHGLLIKHSNANAKGNFLKVLQKYRCLICSCSLKGQKVSFCQFSQILYSKSFFFFSSFFSPELSIFKEPSFHVFYNPVKNNRYVLYLWLDMQHGAK